MGPYAAGRAGSRGIDVRVTPVDTPGIHPAKLTLCALGRGWQPKAGPDGGSGRAAIDFHRIADGLDQHHAAPTVARHFARRLPCPGIGDPRMHLAINGLDLEPHCPDAVSAVGMLDAVRAGLVDDEDDVGN